MVKKAAQTFYFPSLALHISKCKKAGQEASKQESMKNT